MVGCPDALRPASLLGDARCQRVCSLRDCRLSWNEIRCRLMVLTPVTQVIASVLTAISVVLVGIGHLYLMPGGRGSSEAMAAHVRTRMSLWPVVLTPGCNGCRHFQIVPREWAGLLRYPFLRSVRSTCRNVARVLKSARSSACSRWEFASL